MPYKYKKWLIWDNTVLDIMHIVNCKDSINGVCYSKKSVTGCIDMCKGNCSFGYHVTYPDGSTMCFIMDNNSYPYLNPLYHLVDQSTYPKLNKVKISSFVDTEKFSFPPQEASLVFYKDILTLQDISTGATLGAKDDLDIRDNQVIYMGKLVDNNVQFLPIKLSINALFHYVTIKYGDPIRIYVPNTALMVRVDNKSNLLTWQATLSVFDDEDIAFKILPINSNRKIGDDISYGDSFYITYSNIFIVVVNRKYNYLQVVHGKIDTILQNEDYTSVFTLVSKMTGYYCGNSQCKSVAIRDIDKNGKYKGNIVYKKNDCWLLCKKTSKTGYYTIIIVSVILIILSIIFFLIRTYY